MALYGSNKPSNKRKVLPWSFLPPFSLYHKGNGKEGKVHFDLVYTDMAKTTIRHVVFYLSENRFRLNTSFASMP